MGILSRLFGRQRSALAADEPASDVEETPRLPRPVPTRGTHLPRQPPPTAGTRHFDGPDATAGTRTFRSPHGTPSTERIHNPQHPGGR